MARRLLAGLALGVAFAALTTAPAAAETAAEVRALARQAQNDPAALERLRGVTELDGHRADFRGALDTPDPGDLQRRLQTIEDSAGDPTGPAGALGLGEGAARREAERILDGDRYQPNEPPRPFKGAIRRVGDWLEPVLDPIGKALAPIGRLLKALFDSTLGVIAAALLVVLAVALIVSRIAARRTQAMASEAKATRRSDPDLDPRDLDRLAEQAEAAGDFALAFRLRFQAGVARLDKAGVLKDRPSATTGQLATAIRSATFKRLARAFDEIAYGGRRTDRDEVQQAKADWPKVLEESRR